MHWREEYDEKSVDGQSASLSCPALDVKGGGGNGGPSGGITKGAESGDDSLSPSLSRWRFPFCLVRKS